MVSEQASRIRDWIVESALKGVPETEILDGVVGGLNDAGFGVMRTQIGQKVLHPVYAGMGFQWQRGTPAIQIDWEREAGGDGGIASSPFGHLFNHRLTRWRYRIGATNEPAPYSILDELRERGATDYVAFATGFGPKGFDETKPMHLQEGMVSSWTGDRPEGFTDAQLGDLEHVVAVLGLAIKGARDHRMARTLLEVYLGRDAGRRVLAGEVERGSVQSISAVLWYCDLRGFTAIAESTPPHDVIDMLNEYFDAMVGPIHDSGGHVLKFMGDGLMAIFELNGATADVCRVALDTAEEARRRIAEVNRVRGEAGKTVTEFYIALHLGDVLYGNIGSQDRLDFTVVGPAVNEVSRIEAMCRPLERDVIISSAFAHAASACRHRLASLGPYALRGVRRPQELFTLMPPD